ESRQCDGPSELRHVVVVHQSDAGADRIVGQSRQISEQGLYTAETARRESGAPASRQDRREADEAFGQAGELYRRAGARPIQVGSLPVLMLIHPPPRKRGRVRMHYRGGTIAIR